MEDDYKKILSFNDSRDNINSLKDKIKNTLEKINHKQELLQENLNLYISRDGEDNTHFGIDSFSFQIKIIDLEYQNMCRMNSFIKNRIYGSYYKLYNDIYKFLINYHKEDCGILFNKVRKKEDYPVYQDLDPFFEYDQSHILNIHDDIILFLIKIWNIIKNNNLEIEEEKKKVNSGLNLDNYVGYNSFVNNNISNNLSFYVNVLSQYHHYHVTFLNNLYLKIELMWELLNKEIQISGSSQLKENSELNKKISILENIENNNCVKEDIDKSLETKSENNDSV